MFIGIEINPFVALAVDVVAVGVVAVGAAGFGVAFDFVESAFEVDHVLVQWAVKCLFPFENL